MTAAPGSVSIQPLGCGRLRSQRSMFEVGAGDEPVVLPVPSWLIRHPHGTLLFDCGMHEQLTRPGEMLDAMSLLFEVSLDEGALVRSQLVAADVDPAEVDFVVLSHLHFDHVGGLAQVPNARVIVHADEWAAGTDEKLAIANHFRRENFDLGHDMVTVRGEHDVFGDGRVLTLPTPGHTPGHQSLLVRLDSGDVVLCADCAYFQRTLDGGALPPSGHDSEAQATSIEELLRRRKAGARLIPGHDAEVMAALPALLE